MTKKKGLLEGFDLLGDDDKPDVPVHVGDFLEETTRPASPPAPGEGRRKKGSTTAVSKNAAPERAPRSTTPVAATPSTSGRTRLNITDEQRDKLDHIVQEMKRVGPERHLKASEVVDALVSVLHDAREHLDMSMVRRRGKFGTQKHRMYREALAESIRLTIAKHHAG
ncbi:MAG TPA: hypothetical protein VGB13_05895 [Candidatus Krumholzibacteria bacterium]